MNKVGICGNFGGTQQSSSGQIIKTKIILEQLQKALGPDSIQSVNTHGWSRNPIKMLINCISLLRKSDNLIILPANNGIRVFVPLYFFLNKRYRKKLYYIVIGGWLPELLEQNDSLRAQLSQFQGIYVETHTMIDRLSQLGLHNTAYLPNFKPLAILTEAEIQYHHAEPYKLCTFSRVMKEKGIEDAINAVNAINEKAGKIVYTLDIYGHIEDNYRERFASLQEYFPSWISYRGAVHYADSVNVLKEYFALLFPTYYEGEGFAGTILDAYAAGVPVVATDWRYNAEIIQHNHDGLLYPYQQPERLQEILEDCLNDAGKIINLRKNCLSRAKEYRPEHVIGQLKGYLNLNE